jgi:hypothetical protein
MHTSHVDAAAKTPRYLTVTEKQVASLERYWGPDGLMGLGLCYCWYFYDEDGKVVDVEWQYKSD